MQWGECDDQASKAIGGSSDDGTEGRRAHGRSKMMQRAEASSQSSSHQQKQRREVLSRRRASGRKDGCHCVARAALGDDGAMTAGVARNERRARRRMKRERVKRQSLRALASARSSDASRKTAATSQKADGRVSEDGVLSCIARWKAQSIRTCALLGPLR